MMVEGDNVDVTHHGTSRDMLRGPSKVDMDGSDLHYIQEGMLDDGRIHDQKVDVDDRAHTCSVLHVHHDSEEMSVDPKSRTSENEKNMQSNKFKLEMLTGTNVREVLAHADYHVKDLSKGACW